MNKYLFCLLMGAAGIATPAAADVEKPAALVADGIPPVPDDIATRTRAYLEYRTAGFMGWNVLTRSMLIRTRFGDTSQLHIVDSPKAARRQITFEAEPVSGSWSPKGDVLAVEKDIGGNEFYQIFTLQKGQLSLVTDGTSRNSMGAWSKDGRWIGYSSTRRNGTDADLYIVDPRDPKTNRMVAQVAGGGWDIADFSPDGRHAVVYQLVSATKSNLHLLDLETGKLTPIGDHSKQISYGGAEFAADGKLWTTSDEGSDFLRLGTIDLTTGAFNPVAGTKWDVESFEIAPDGSFIALSTNVAGVSRISLLDPKTGKSREVKDLPLGIAGAMKIAPWGEIGLTYTAARSPGDAYSINPKTLKVTRWTESETGGLKTKENVEPELVEIKSFDGEPITGFLFRPDPVKFPGPRPLEINMHGGPEDQARPLFLGRLNYFLNERGIALFMPNVRGSSGYGKRFLALDDGPFKREDSVKDIGAFLDVFAKDKAIDSSRVAVAGGSYGGYLCYATAIRYGDRLKAAYCVVAISNFVTFLENTQSYRRDLRRVEYGDERDPQQRAKLIEISPLTHVDRLKIPLLVATGGNDPRVPASEAKQIVEAVRANGGSAWHLLAENEGHGFGRKENSDYQFWVRVMFWDKWLLGQDARAMASQ